jgi:hypothetical protein
MNCSPKDCAPAQGSARRAPQVRVAAGALITVAVAALLRQRDR